MSKIDPGITSVNGKPAPWTDDIRAAWDKVVVPKFREGESCVRANYFTPRPYVDEYNRGSDRTGFVYTVKLIDGSLSVCVAHVFIEIGGAS